MLDVAGQDESLLSLDPASPLSNPSRDSTTLTIVGLDFSTLSTLERPSYRVLQRHSWLGTSHLAIFGALKNLAARWDPTRIVIDATGVGEGLWALLDRHFPTRVIPVKFTLQEKSEIGWRFLAIIETGRFTDPSPTDEVRLQYSRCVREILPGPGKTLRWGVPPGSRGPDGSLIHDDFVLADSLTAVLDRLEWSLPMATTILQPSFDPLKEMSKHF